MNLAKSSTEKQRQRPDYNGAVTALTPAEWAALSAKNDGLFLVVMTDPDGDAPSLPWDHAAALRIFDGVLDRTGEDFAPGATFSMRVMSVSEWARVGAR